MKNYILATLLTINLPALAAGNQQQGATFVSVGDDNVCDFTSIQNAIDHGVSDVIRIASNKNYFESLFIQNDSKTLVGGYADCTMAGLNITDLSQAFITSNGSDSALRVEAIIEQDVEVTVRNLVLANGGAGVSVSAQHGGHAEVLLDNLRLFNNDNSGLAVSNFNVGSALVHVKDSLIDFNQESGINCMGDGLKVRVGGDTVIADNDGNNGGGLHASDQCQADVFSPTIIRNNTAMSSGGGVYAIDTTVSIQSLGESCDNGVCFGEPDKPVTISGNEAFSGGGVYASLGSTTVGIYNSLIEDNQASQGGGIAAADGAVMQVLGYQSPGTTCWSPAACMQINDNQAEGGGAIRVNGAAQVVLQAARVVGNTAHNGVALHLTGDAEMTLRNSVLADNGRSGAGTYADSNLLYLHNTGDQNAANLTVDGVTIADNHITTAVMRNSNGGHIEVLSSMVFDPQDVYSDTGAGASSQFECVIAHENLSFSAGGTVSVVDRQIQPVFVNPGMLNYRLRVDSPAIDYCYDASGNNGTDMEYDDRGVDDPDVGNLHGSYDVGADEYHPANDVIFADGFNGQ